MTDKNEWERFFDGHAPEYMDNVFTKNTLAEVDFIIDVLKPAPGASFLDMGCGTGRHAVELAKRGFRVTGVDQSSGMLAQAEKAAGEAGVEIALVKSDAVKYVSGVPFDAAICLCEGALALLGTGDDPIDRDLKILCNVFDSLKPGAKLLMTTLNGLLMARQYTPEDVQKGKFDPLSMTERNTMEFETAEGKQSVEVRERGYVPTEIRLLLRLAGFDVLNIWGGTAGNWGKRPLDLDEIEMMILSVKPQI